MDRNNRTVLGLPPGRTAIAAAAVARKEDPRTLQPVAAPVGCHAVAGRSRTARASVASDVGPCELQRHVREVWPARPLDAEVAGYGRCRIVALRIERRTDGDRVEVALVPAGGSRPLWRAVEKLQAAGLSAWLRDVARGG